MAFPQQMGLSWCGSYRYFLLRHHKAAAMKPKISVGTTGCKCKKADGSISHSTLAKWWLMSARCIKHFNNYVPVI
jgi:hypothetical protein